MSKPYTKTAWVNDQAPAISATNLNKMEQGIADANSILFNDYGTITSGTLVIEADKYNYVKATIGADTTISFTGWPVVGEITLELVNGGAYAITWPAGLETAGGSGFSLTSSGTDFLEFLSNDTGTTIRGFQSAEAML